jgi:tRNA (guanine37-N1)-methyltransferase
MVRSKAVRAPREEGEETRQRLDEEGVLDRDLRIQEEDGYLYIPVSDEPAEGDVEVRDFEEREGQKTPADVLGYEPSFEVVGDVALLEPDEGGEAGRAVVEADNSVETALRIESAVKGEERTRELGHVAGEERTETVHREYGREFIVDLSDIYFSPRLAEERERVASQVEGDEKVFDMFAGVGPFTVAVAGRGADAVASDINEEAVEYLLRNAERNNVGERVTVYNADAREVVSETNVDADRVVMNLPHTANEFLDVACESLGDDGGVVHYYDIRHEDDLFEGAVEEMREVADRHGYDVEVLETVVVRSYAPYDYNVCIDFCLSPSP